MEYKAVEYLKVQVFEKQWGGVTADYITYYKSEADVKKFETETGFETKILGKVTL